MSHNAQAHHPAGTTFVQISPLLQTRDYMGVEHFFVKLSVDRSRGSMENFIPNFGDIIAQHIILGDRMGWTETDRGLS